MRALLQLAVIHVRATTDYLCQLRRSSDVVPEAHIVRQAGIIHTAAIWRKMFAVQPSYERPQALCHLQHMFTIRLLSAEDHQQSPGFQCMKVHYCA